MCIPRMGRVQRIECNPVAVSITTGALLDWDGPNACAGSKICKKITAGAIGPKRGWARRPTWAQGRGPQRPHAPPRAPTPPADSAVWRVCARSLSARVGSLPRDSEMMIRQSVRNARGLRNESPSCVIRAASHLWPLHSLPALHAPNTCGVAVQRAMLRCSERPRINENPA